MIGKQQTPHHAKKILTVQSDVYKLKIPAGTQEFWFQLKDLPAYKLQYSYDDVDAWAEKTFMTVPAGGSVSKTGLVLENDITLYIKCPDAAGQYIVLEYWT